MRRRRLENGKIVEHRAYFANLMNVAKDSNKL